MATVSPILMSGISANCIMEPDQKDDIVRDLKRMCGDRPIGFLRPCRIGQDPINRLVPCAKVAALADLAPITRFRKIIVECAVASAGVEHPSCWTKMVDQPSSQLGLRRDDIV